MRQYDALSRYSLDETGLTATRSDVPTTRRYIAYTVRQTDTLESIAARHLGNPRRYWELADINPQIKFPLDIPMGTVIRLPT